MKAVVWHGTEDVRVERAGPGDPGADGRDRPDHVVGDLRFRPAPLQGALQCTWRRATSSGTSPWGSSRRSAPDVKHIKAGRPRRPAVQYRVRTLLHVRARPPFAVRDDAGARAEQGGGALRLHAGCTAQMPGGQAENLRVPQAQYGPIKVPEGPSGRAFPLSLGRDPHRLAGRQSTRMCPGWHARRLRLGPDRPVLRPRREAAGCRAGARDRSRSGATRACTQHEAETVEWTRRRRSGLEIMDLTDGRGADSVIDAVGNEVHGAPAGSSLQTEPSRSPSAVATKVMERVGSDRRWPCRRRSRPCVAAALCRRGASTGALPRRCR